MTDRELLEQALMYLKLPGAYVYIDGVKALIKDIEARLAMDAFEEFERLRIALEKMKERP